jgi:hypothetical protein
MVEQTGSAQDQKANFGKSPETAEPTGPVVTEGTKLSVDKANLKAIVGAPSLLKQRKDAKTGEWVNIDFWNDVLKGNDVKNLTEILNQSSTDKAYDMTAFIRGIEYQGFDRLFYIKAALELLTVSEFSRFAIIGALRGSNFEKIQDSCEDMPRDLPAAFRKAGFVKTPKKRTDLTILRNTASIPHWCVYWFRRAGVDKKIPTLECPAELQFPGAASLPMSKEVRMQHLDFCYQFSQLLTGGKFNMNIYLTAMKNMIPVGEIPLLTMEILKVASASEAYMLQDVDTQKYDQTKQMVTR